MATQSTERITNPAPLVPTDALIDKRTGKPKRIPAKVRRAIKLIATGECTTTKAAAERVGMHPDWLRRVLAMPHVGTFIARTARETIGAAQLRASARMVELIDADSEHVSADMSKHVSAINGLAPPTGPGITINNTVSAGYVIELKGAPSIGHDAQSDAKPLIEQETVPQGE